MGDVLFDTEEGNGSGFVKSWGVCENVLEEDGGKEMMERLGSERIPAGRNSRCSRRSEKAQK